MSLRIDQEHAATMPSKVSASVVASALWIDHLPMATARKVRCQQSIPPGGVVTTRGAVPGHCHRRKGGRRLLKDEMNPSR